VLFKQPEPGYVKFKKEQHGFDDALEGSDGNWWIVEYKGGEGKRTPEQMEVAWVRKNIQILQDEGNQWGDKLGKAMKEGKLRGFSIETPYEPGIGAGQTRVEKTWEYR
jgi:hypothetical protein